MDHMELKDWIPLVMDGREKSQKIAATRITRGTDIDFGNLTRSYIKQIESKESIEINFLTNVENLQQDIEGDWYLSLEGVQTKIELLDQSLFSLEQEAEL